MADIYQLHRHSLPAANSSHGGHNSMPSNGSVPSAGRPEARKSATHSNVRPIADEQLARIMDDWNAVGRDYPMTFVPSPEAPSFGERLVETARRWQFTFGLVCYGIAVVVGMYFAFQLGRGVL